MILKTRHTTESHTAEQLATFLNNLLANLGLICVIYMLMYEAVLEKRTSPSTEALFANKWFFQDDNMKFYQAKKIKSWKEQNIMTSIDWLAHSQELNPIEDLWQRVARIVSKE